MTTYRKTQGDSPMLRPHYEPPAHERTWVRSASTGDRGWMVRREGTTYVRLDRPNEEQLRPYRVTDWIPEAEHRPLSPIQVAYVTFEADRALCKMMALHDLARREWASLTDSDRIRWMEDGPMGHEDRRKVHAALKGALMKIATES